MLEKIKKFANCIGSVVNWLVKCTADIFSARFIRGEKAETRSKERQRSEESVESVPLMMQVKEVTEELIKKQEEEKSEALVKQLLNARNKGEEPGGCGTGAVNELEANDEYAVRQLNNSPSPCQTKEQSTQIA